MDMLSEDLVYGGRKKSLILPLKCLFSEGITQCGSSIFQALSRRWAKSAVFPLRQRHLYGNIFPLVSLIAVWK